MTLKVGLRSPKPKLGFGDLSPTFKVTSGHKYQKLVVSKIPPDLLNKWLSFTVFDIGDYVFL